MCGSSPDSIPANNGSQEGIQGATKLSEGPYGVSYKIPLIKSVRTACLTIRSLSDSSPQKVKKFSFVIFNHLSRDIEKYRLYMRKSGLMDRFQYLQKWGTEPYLASF